MCVVHKVERPAYNTVMLSVFVDVAQQFKM